MSFLGGVLPVGVLQQLGDQCPRLPKTQVVIDEHDRMRHVCQS
ncbi:hypothetical protein [Segniliparus rotundus]|nr:hypothetical protein [Segniliparus rotundus]